jgi:hypothetical protein
MVVDYVVALVELHSFILRRNTWTMDYWEIAENAEPVPEELITRPPLEKGRVLTLDMPSNYRQQFLPEMTLEDKMQHAPFQYIEELHVKKDKPYKKGEKVSKATAKVKKLTPLSYTQPSTGLATTAAAPMATTRPPPKPRAPRASRAKPKANT